MRILSDIQVSLGITMPVFLLVMAGLFFRKTGLMTEAFARALNRFVFQIALPVSIFQQLFQAEFRSIWDGKFLIFCFLATLAQILIGVFVSRWIGNANERGEFVQASYRSSTALLGLAYLQQAYGSASASALMMVGCVPLYNVAAVFLLEQKKPDSAQSIRLMLREIVRNPIIWSIVLGFFFSYLRIPIPAIGQKTLASLAALASPAGLLAMGASIDLGRMRSEKRPILLASLLKLVLFPAIFLPIAAGLGFRTEKLMAILIMLGSATTVASYTMAVNMEHDGEITAGAIMVTTLGSAITMTMWIFVLRLLGMV